MVVVFGLVLGVIKMTESDTVSEVDVAKARAEFIADIYATRVTKGSLDGCYRVKLKNFYVVTNHNDIFLG